MHEDRVIKKLDELDAKISHLDTKIDHVAAKTDQLDIKINNIAFKTVALDAKIDRLATQEEVANLRNFVETEFDKHTVILQRLDQERIFTTDHVQRIGNELEEVKLKLVGQV